MNILWVFGKKALEDMVGERAAEGIIREVKIQKECSRNRHLNPQTRKPYQYDVILPANTSSRYPYEVRHCTHCDDTYRV